MTDVPSPLQHASPLLPLSTAPRIRRLRAWWIVALALTACLPDGPSCDVPADVLPEGARPFRVISYNIGNSDRTEPYGLRLSDLRYEEHVAARIAALAPELVFLQEVLAPTQCAGVDEQDPLRSCFDADGPPQVRRLLGADYSIVCDANRHVECLGVHRSFGTIRGLEAGGFDLAGADTAPLPGAPCDYLRGECSGRSSRCDAESSISNAVLDTLHGPVRVVHVHPTAIGKSCLQRQLRQAFALADDLPTLLAGDWNFDPTSGTDLVPASIWHSWVGEDARFSDHSPVDGQCRPERTSVSQDASLDRVISDFAQGACRVWREPRLDDGADFATLEGGRIDHFAVDCTLTPKGP